MLIDVLFRLRILDLGTGVPSSVNSESSSSLVPNAASNKSLLSVDARLREPEPNGTFVGGTEGSEWSFFPPSSLRSERGTTTFVGPTDGEVISMGQKASESPAEIMSSLFASVL